MLKLIIFLIVLVECLAIENNKTAIEANSARNTKESSLLRNQLEELSDEEIIRLIEASNEHEEEDEELNESAKSAILKIPDDLDGTYDNLLDSYLSTTLHTTTQATTTTQKHLNYQRIKFNESLILTWSTKDLETFKINLFSSIEPNIILWYYPTINSLALEVLKSNKTSEYTIFRLPHVKFENLFILFDEPGRINIYLDCPSINKPKLTWEIEALNYIQEISLPNYIQVYLSLDNALKHHLCKILITVQPSMVLYMKTNLSIQNTVLLFSFNSDGVLYSLIYFNGILKLVSSHGANIPIAKYQYLTAPNGIYFLFLNESVQIYTECPNKARVEFIWFTKIFRKKIQIETSLENLPGIGINEKFLEKYCLSKYLIDLVDIEDDQYKEKKFQLNQFDFMLIKF